MKTAYVLFIALFFSTVTFANADLFDTFLGKSTKNSTVVSDKEGFFFFEVPASDNCQKDVKHVFCTPKNKKDVYTIEARVTTLPANVKANTNTVKLIALNRLEKEKVIGPARTKMQKIHRQLLENKPDPFRGNVSNMQKFSYDQLNNVQMNVEVTIRDILKGRMHYEIKTICQPASCRKYKSLLSKVFSGFHITPLTNSGNPEKNSHNLRNTPSNSLLDFGNFDINDILSQ